MRCDTPPGHLVNSVTVAWKRQHASFHSAPLSAQACQDYRHFSSTSTPQEDLYWCRWKCRCNVLPSGFVLPSLGKKKSASVSSGMVDKLISCLRLLLSLRAVNGFYNSINSTLAAQWVNCLSALHNLCQSSCCTRSYSDVTAKTAAIMWLAYNGIFMLCTNKTKMTVLGWPKTTPLARFHEVCSVTGSFPSPALESSRLLVLAERQYFGRHWQTCSPVIKPRRPTPFFHVSKYLSVCYIRAQTISHFTQ